MSIYNELLGSIELPRMHRIHQQIDHGCLSDVPGALREELKRSCLLSRVKAGAKVAVTAGSREIANYALILKTLCDELKRVGAEPFIIPAMGSHGGAVAENQTELLAHFGIDEAHMGVPIRSSMEVVHVGDTPRGVPVFFDHYAAAADAIIPVGRIKIHTCFHGPIESGVMKMLAVGCGKQRGAAAMHEHGFPNMCQNVTEVARVDIEKLPVVFGVGILENACHQTRALYAIPAEDIERRESEIVEEARRLAPRIPFDKIDVLIVDEIGKNISGTCMDPNITGRSSPLGTFRPFADRVAALDLTEMTDGCAYGVGNADVVTKRLFDKIIMENTYPNGITNRDVKPMMIPPVMPSDEMAIRFAVATMQPPRPTGELRVVWLHNTLCMESFYASEALAADARQSPDLRVDGEPYLFHFGTDGEVLKPY